MKVNYLVCVATTRLPLFAIFGKQLRGSVYTLRGRGCNSQPGHPALHPTTYPTFLLCCAATLSHIAKHERVPALSALVPPKSALTRLLPIQSQIPVQYPSTITDCINTTPNRFFTTPRKATHSTHLEIQLLLQVDLNFARPPDIDVARRFSMVRFCAHIPAISLLRIRDSI